MSTATQFDKKLLDEMFDSACHFGHKASKWNPKMRPYLYMKNEGVHIFDLTKTCERLSKALEFLTQQAADGKTILLVSTKLHVAKLVSEAANRCGQPYVTRKWMPGLLTNFETLKKRIKYFKDLRDQRDNGELEKYTKKERLELSRELAKLEEAFSGVENMNGHPNVVVVFDSLHDALALREARRLKIPTVGICDSNADPDLLAYPIPGNDDAVKSLKFFIGKIAAAIEEGKKMREQAGAVRLEKRTAPEVAAAAAREEPVQPAGSMID